MSSQKLEMIGTLTGSTLLMMAEPAHAGVLPIPQPETLVLLGVGVAAVGAVAWWRRRK